MHHNLERMVSRRSSAEDMDARKLSSRFSDRITEHFGAVKGSPIQDSTVIIPGDQDVVAPSQKCCNQDLETGAKLSDPGHSACCPADQIISIKPPATCPAADVPGKQRDYVPILRLLRKHTPAVLLQFLFEAWVSIGFWVITTWLPVQMKKPPINMPEILTQVIPPVYSQQHWQHPLQQVLFLLTKPLSI